MNTKNRKTIYEIVNLAGAVLTGKLPPHPGLQRRNAFAHLWERISSTMGRTYKECDDSDFDTIVGIINKQVLLYVKDCEELDLYLLAVKLLKEKSEVETLN